MIDFVSDKTGLLSIFFLNFSSVDDPSSFLTLAFKEEEIRERLKPVDRNLADLNP